MCHTRYFLWQLLMTALFLFRKFIGILRAILMFLFYQFHKMGMKLWMKNPSKRSQDSFFNYQQSLLPAKPSSQEYLPRVKYWWWTFNFVFLHSPCPFLNLIFLWQLSLLCLIRTSLDFGNLAFQKMGHNPKPLPLIHSWLGKKS